MPPKWIFEFYEDQYGYIPVMEYIFQGNDAERIALLTNVIQHLMAVGPEIQGTKMDKQIDGSLRELRKDRHRILYGRIGNRFILLSAFMKDSQKTPPEEIQLALQRFEECKKRPPFQPLRFR